MAKQNSYLCTECGWTTLRWVGRCGECQTWGNVIQKDSPPITRISPVTPSAKAAPINEVPTEATHRQLTGITELDRVLGGGLVPGAVILLAGEPGIGKSTLLLEVAARWAAASRRTLYVSGEESTAQIKLRGQRTGALSEQLYLAAENDLGAVLGHVDQVDPTLLIVDSVQTIGTTQIDGSPGGVTQVRAVTSGLIQVAKRQQLPVLIVGHVTKDGGIAGPRLLEHLVDVVLTFEGDRHSGFRMVRATKNRYGPADEVGCFEMGESGIVEVTDPSGLFTSSHPEPMPGTCITVTQEGRRPLLAEVQALVAPAPYQVSPRRVSHGIDQSRVSLILAVLERKARLRLHQSDVYVATIGGARLSDPSADLATAIAIASAAVDRNYPHRMVALGEIGLAGDLRRVPGLERRLSEAARLGMELAIVPTGSRDLSIKVPKLANLKVVETETLADALGVLDLRRPNSS